MGARIKKIAGLLKAEKADALLVWNNEGSGQPATQWLSGFTGSSSLLVLTKDERFLVTDGRYDVQARKEATQFRVHVVRKKHPTSEVLRRCLHAKKVRTVLFDGQVTTYSDIERLKKLVPDIKVVSRGGVLQEVRATKDADEHKLLAMVAELACRAFLKLLPQLHRGMTEQEIAQILEILCAEEGSEGMAFPTIVASGVHGALPHAKPTHKRVQPGELVTIDFGVLYKGYASDMTRTVAFGKVSSRLRAVYTAVQEAQKRGCRKIKAGVSAGDVDTACRAYLTKRRLGAYFIHSTGHGLGMQVHELPHISPSCDTPLQAGEVITCEPGVYIPGVGGVRIEDTLIVTKTGSKNLTASVPKDLVVVDSSS